MVMTHRGPFVTTILHTDKVTQVGGTSLDFSSTL